MRDFSQSIICYRGSELAYSTPTSVYQCPYFSKLISKDSLRVHYLFSESVIEDKWLLDLRLQTVPQWTRYHTVCQIELLLMIIHWVMWHKCRVFFVLANLPKERITLATSRMVFYRKFDKSVVKLPPENIHRTACNANYICFFFNGTQSALIRLSTL